jgi:hypothetical protein
LSRRLWDKSWVANWISCRLNAEARRALSLLTGDRTPISAVRNALIEVARLRAQERLRAEAAELAADPEDQAESARILRDIAALRAW